MPYVEKKKHLNQHSEMESPYTQKSASTLEEARKETGLDFVMRFWNRQFHVLIKDRHVFCGYEYECQAFLQGASAAIKWRKMYGEES